MDDDSKLERLEKELYRRRPEFGERSREPFLRPHEVEKVPRFWSPLFLPASHPGGGRRINWRVALLWFAILFLVAFLVVYSFIVFQPTSFRTEDVKFEIFAPRNVRTGDVITYTVRIRNDARIPIEDLVIDFEYPKQSPSPAGEERSQIKIPILGGGGAESSQEFQSRIVGLEGELRLAQAKLSFKPQGTSSRLERQASFSSTVIEFPIRLTLTLEPQVNPDEPVELAINYFSEATTLWSDVAIEVEYPPGFAVFSTDPPSQEGNHWRIGQLLPKTGGTIKIRGVASQDQLPDLRFRVRIGVFEEDKKDWKVWTESVASSVLVPPPVTLRASINDVVLPEQVANPGQTLNVNIVFRNNREQAIENVRIKAALAGRGFREDNLLVYGGAYDSTEKVVQWAPGSNKFLERINKGSEGTVSFQITVPDPPPMKTTQDQNFSFTIKTELEAEEAVTDKPVRSVSQVVVKVNSRLELRSQVFWKGSVFAPRGPLPPQVGKTTLFTVSLQLANLANDVENVLVTVLLPPNVKWENLVSPDGAKVTFLPESGIVKWDVGRLRAGAGSIRPAQTVAFRISITPSPPNVNNVVPLYTEIKARGVDAFTKKVLEVPLEGKNTGNLSDIGFVHEKGVVKP